jgi:hypothetical protein
VLAKECYFNKNLKINKMKSKNPLKIQREITFTTFLALLHPINRNHKIFKEIKENIQKYRARGLYQEK